MQKPRSNPCPRITSYNVCYTKLLRNAIAPGPFPSRLTDVSSDAVRASIARHIPLGRAGEPEDVEGLVVFLASRAGAYINGVTIPLDGGYMAAL